MSDNLTPFEVAERLVGPPDVLEKICGVRPKSSYAWRRAARGRCAGFFPLHIMRLILSHAQARDIPLTEAHMIWGASEAEIVGLLENLDLRLMKDAG